MKSKSSMNDDFVNGDVDPHKYIGCVVRKCSGKPFKSGAKTNTVKGVTILPQMCINAFTFQEDDSAVECRRCVLTEQEVPCV